MAEEGLEAAVEVEETLYPEPWSKISTSCLLGKGFHRERLTVGREPLGLEQTLMFQFSFIPEDWVVAVGAEEATEKGTQEYPRS